MPGRSRPEQISKPTIPRTIPPLPKLSSLLSRRAHLRHLARLPERRADPVDHELHEDPRLGILPPAVGEQTRHLDRLGRRLFRHRHQSAGFEVLGDLEDWLQHDPVPSPSSDS